MARSWFFAALLGLVVATTGACAVNQGIERAGGDGVGIVPIGGVPQDMDAFVASDCSREPRFSDCSAQDAEGRRYAFFGGALSKVSITKDEAAQTLRLPAGMQFGEEVETSAKKVSSAMGVKLDRGSTLSGQTVYSSDFIIQSPAGVLYSIELIADEEGLLTEVVERTDF